MTRQSIPFRSIPCQYSPHQLKYLIKNWKLIYDIDYQGLMHISISQLKRVSIQLPQLFWRRHIEIVLMVKDSFLEGLSFVFQPVNGTIIEKILTTKHNLKIPYYTKSTNTMSSNMTDFIYGRTQKGKALLILDGYDFTKKREIKSTNHWRCAK